MNPSVNPSMNADESRELSLTRLIDAPPKELYDAWTKPQLLMQWFCPKPWTVSAADLDLRVGGSNLIVMRSPEGEEFPNRGVYLEVEPNRRLVFTDAYTKAWEPSSDPFMRVTITYEAEAGKTRYTARVSHWSVESRKKHEAMGFYEGWSVATDQLEALVGRQG